MKVKLYVQALKWDFLEDFDIQISPYPVPPGDDRVVVDLSEVEIEVPVPEFTKNQLQLEEVKQLQQRITEEKNASHCRVTAIEEKIQSLLCIEAQ